MVHSHCLNRFRLGLGKIGPDLDIMELMQVISDLYLLPSSCG